VWGRLLCLILPAVVAFDSHAIDASQLAVVYNTSDRDSKTIAEYYAQRRRIPDHHLIPISIEAPRHTLDEESFEALLNDVNDRTSAYIEAFVLAWTLPFRVECMSITSAFAFGFDRQHCARGCEPIAANPYFDSPSRSPYVDHDIRPTMLLAGRTVDEVKSLIDRGVRSDYTHPKSSAYLVVTPDRNRNTRLQRYVMAERIFADRYPVKILETDGVRGISDVMFYFTGTKRVPHLGQVGFVPGAIADHLTSTGGVLRGGAQMSILEWIGAGATGSYGTVVEPCNFPQKFPDPPLAMKYYLNGETLMEAYWKSVYWPGQGVFVGEPLAQPFGRRPESVSVASGE
jgi:uncharacterized protein (TIGR03790 family)